jgi:16S rRNA A1518/A1519 N6-dimethyltransferase RsmA/KsgA/DIM1 with predicted DNA glycosylase/AP lyase activity
MWFWLLLALGFGAGVAFGAPFLPVLRRNVDSALDLADLRAGETLLDLGSGDGRMLRAAAKRGAFAIGYEINPWLYIWSLIACWPWRKQITVHWRNFWVSEWPRAEVIFVFLITHHMARLERELELRLKQPTRVVSFAYRLPRRRPDRSNQQAALYRYP